MVRFVLASLLLIIALSSGRSEEPSQGEIKAQSSSNLVAWLDWNLCPSPMRDYDDCRYRICDELLARHQVGFLVKEYAGSTNSETRKFLAGFVLSDIKDRRVVALFRQRLSESEDEESYYIADYLARRGDRKALEVLNRHYYQYPIPSFVWASTIELFGKYRYRPAISNLVESLDAASLNVSGAACNALHKMFPDSPRKFYGPNDAENYYRKRLHQPAS